MHNMALHSLDEGCMTKSPQEIAERRIQEIYDEANAFADAHGGVEPYGMNILLGPPVVNAELMIVSVQGGGKDRKRQRTWPTRLLYAHPEIDIDPETGRENRFGAALRKDFCEFGLSNLLERRTVASNIVFPQWPDQKGGFAGWRKHAPAARIWERRSREWLSEIISILKPRLIVTYGKPPFEALTGRPKLAGMISEGVFAATLTLGCVHPSFRGETSTERRMLMTAIQNRIDTSPAL
jgi:hypothetical protein